MVPSIAMYISHLFTQLNDQTVLFLTIQSYLSFVYIEFKCQTVLFDPLIGSCQVLLLWACVDLEAMAMKGYFAFSKAPALLEPHYQIV